MLAGRKGREIEKSVYLQESPAPLNNKRVGFTLVEGLVTVFILLLLISALFLVLNIGNLSESISATKIQVQQEVRRAMDWMVKDLRQTDRMRLRLTNSEGEPDKQFNSLSDGEIFTDPQFQVSIGYDTTTKEIIPSPNQIGYTFDATNQRITRTDLGTNQAWKFNYIANLEFRKVSRDILRVTISGEKTARGTIRPSFTLQEEVKLRN